MGEVRCVDCGKVLFGVTTRTKRCPECKIERDREMKRLRAEREAAQLRELPPKDAPRTIPTVRSYEEPSLKDSRRTRVFDGRTCSVKYRGSGFYAN